MKYTIILKKSFVLHNEQYLQQYLMKFSFVIIFVIILFICIKQKFNMEISRYVHSKLLLYSTVVLLLFYTETSQMHTSAGIIRYCSRVLFYNFEQWLPSDRIYCLHSLHKLLTVLVGGIARFQDETEYLTP